MNLGFFFLSLFSQVSFVKFDNYSILQDTESGLDF